jgi:hypothetical protein
MAIPLPSEQAVQAALYFFDIHAMAVELCRDIDDRDAPLAHFALNSGIDRNAARLREGEHEANAKIMARRLRALKISATNTVTILKGEQDFHPKDMACRTPWVKDEERREKTYDPAGK